MATLDAKLPPAITMCYLEDVSWSFYERLLEELGDRSLRLAYLDGQMEFISPRVVSGKRPDQYFYLDGVSWSFYERALEEFRERNLRITYLDGEMEIMSPLPEHEAYKRAICDLIVFLACHYEVPRKSFGSTTFRSKSKRGGVEPDECFYFGEVESVAGMKRFNPKVHRAPDLVIEADVFNSSVPRQPIYARLGVREIWRYDGSSLGVFLLDAGTTYVASSSSLAFPAVPINGLAKFVKRMIGKDETRTLAEFKKWLESLPKT